MNYLLMPWELELDVDATKELYERNNYATDQRANDEFISKLSAEQKDFFETLGVSLDKIKVDKKICCVENFLQCLPFRKNFTVRKKYLAKSFRNI